ncbi:L-amino acid oxidase 1 [Mycena pura]|uniref:L-amino acid oxidase 1 n=1 Tax=Mycena pura TaxID=153505 RepID=A0AAD6UQK7_9AGAR|nr:L-amino acid oxidase 1 [Mycena pura]
MRESLVLPNLTHISFGAVMADRDGSSVRVQVAQYFVNQKLRELETNNPQIKIDDWTFQQALPEVAPDEHGTYDPDKPDTDEPPQLPPLFPTPTDGYVPWKDLLEFHRNRMTRSEWRPKFPSWYRVAIIGAGVAGLQTAQILKEMGIPYKIFEASDRPGGRVYTYEFASKPPGNPKGKHDYHDVGAMRFPDNDANKATFQLFKELRLSPIKYVLSQDDNILEFNNIRTTAAVASTQGDHFKDVIVPKEYLNKEHVDLRGKTVYGVDACAGAAYDPFRKALIDDFDAGWNELMKYDWASTRSYLAREKPKYPLSVVHWMENRTSGTGGFDKAFSEEILESLEFDDPKDVKWWCLEGGTKGLIDAMLKKLMIPPKFPPNDRRYPPIPPPLPSYGQRVTSVEGPFFLSPHRCYPDLPRSPRWPRFPFMKVGVSDAGAEYFSHVVSTASFANLGTINTQGVPMTYKQRQAIRTLNYGPAVKVAIKFKTRWWETMKQIGGSSRTDRQSRVVVYPSYGVGDEGPGVLMVTYNWHQDANRFGALIKNSDWSKQLDPDRERPASEKVLLEQIYGDLASLHGLPVEWLREQSLDYHAFDWYHNPFTMGAFAHYGPGQFSTFFADIVQPAAFGRFHFAGEVASAHHAWIAGALDSAERVANEILFMDCPFLFRDFREHHPRSTVFSDEKAAEAHFVRGLFSDGLEKVGL